MNSGILNINKPAYLTSHDVVDQVRKIISFRRVGHAGTLDPLATGVLLILIGQATKLQAQLMSQEKTYLATIRLGAISDTYDQEGVIKIQKIKKKISKKEIEKALKQFKGIISQIPPIYSAIKIKGRRAYQLARAGQKIKLKPRKIKINQIKLLDYHWPDLKIEVSCGQGTYIRSLAHDLGQALTCGAYLKELTRTRIGNFEIKKAISLNKLTSKNWSKRLIVLE